MKDLVAMAEETEAPPGTTDDHDPYADVDDPYLSDLARRSHGKRPVREPGDSFIGTDPYLVDLAKRKRQLKETD